MKKLPALNRWIAAPLLGLGVLALAAAPLDLMSNHGDGGSILAASAMLAVGLLAIAAGVGLWKARRWALWAYTGLSALLLAFCAACVLRSGGLLFPALCGFAAAASLFCFWRDQRSFT